MTERPYTHNELSGQVRGPVVQSGAMRDVVINSSTAPVTETQRRWEERQRRILDEEEAQRASDQRRFTGYVRVIRVKRRMNVVFVLLEGLAVVLGHLRVIPVLAEVLGLFLGAISVSGVAHCTWVIKRAESGRTIKVPRSRWMW
ncbi:hypothetical protein [Streptomyces noursei]|uniref:hypothetical protein n=1 Tax=Streptomyces noursei TaxID=1971 RepID=UPI0011AF16E2|nr:hypothetical protein [Streptomyces noursei]